MNPHTHPPPPPPTLVHLIRNFFYKKPRVSSPHRDWCKGRQGPGLPTKPDVWLETIYKLKSSVIIIPRGLFFLVCFDILTTEPTKSPKNIIQIIIFPVYVFSTSKILETSRIFYKEQPPCQTPLTSIIC